MNRDIFAVDRYFIFLFFQKLFFCNYSRFFYYRKKTYTHYFMFSLNYKFFFKNFSDSPKFLRDNIEFINVFAPRNFFFTYRDNRPVRSVSGGSGLSIVDRGLRSTKFYQIKLIRNHVIDILALGGMRVNVVFNNFSEKLVSFAGVYSSLIIRSNYFRNQLGRNFLRKISVDNNVPHGFIRGCRKPSRKKYLQRRGATVEF